MYNSIKIILIMVKNYTQNITVCPVATGEITEAGEGSSKPSLYLQGHR